MLVQSAETGLVFNRAFRPELVEYDADYQNEQGLSGAFARHLDAVLDVMRRHFAGRSLVEVGCGKGLFLERLLGAGFDVTGLDPTYEGSNPRVIREFFTPAVGIRAEGIVLRHVLEHVPGPGRVPGRPARGQRRPRHDLHRGAVPRLDRASITPGSTSSTSTSTTSGASTSSACSARSTRPGIRSRASTSTSSPTWRRSGRRAGRATTCSSCRRGSCRRSTRAASALGRSGGTARAIWGGASKGVIFALLMERAGVRIDTVIDINPAKQGRYLAATGLRVQSPDEAMAHLPAGADVFVMNSNYLRRDRGA